MDILLNFFIQTEFDVVKLEDFDVNTVLRHCGKGIESNELCKGIIF